MMGTEQRKGMICQEWINEKKKILEVLKL